MTASTWSHIRNFHLPYLREFQRLGWEIHVGCKDIPTEAPYIDETIYMPFEKKMWALNNLRATHILRNRVKEVHYDLIITHTSLAAFFTRLAVRNIKCRPKLINVVHGYLFDENTPFLKRQMLLNAERLTAPQTDLLLTMNRWDYETAKTYRLGKQIKWIPGMGVDFSKLDRATPEDGMRLREDLGIASSTFVLLYAAEFSARKSQHVLIEALVKLPQNAVLVLCGDGVLRENCQKLAKRLGVANRVLFPGQIDDMASWYQLADMAISASRSEGLPFNVMEAMHVGLPVVASAIKGHVDLLMDGETGLLFSYGDTDACAKQVQRLKDTPSLKEKLRVQGKINVEKYALGRVLPQVMTRYLQTL